MVVENIQKGIYIYPWDLLDGGVEQTIQNIEAAGCNSIIVNSSYHHVRALRPAIHSIKSLNYAAASFGFDENLYGRLKPYVLQEIADGRVFERTREYCQNRKIHFSTWWVGLHNSSLGQENPGLCVENIWGDKYLYSLCPSNEEVQKYATALFEDTLQNVQPERIVTESAAFMTMTHGEHHELMAISIGQSLQWLLSLCFCKDCCRAAEEKGCNSDKIKKITRHLLDHFVRIDTGNIKQDDYNIAFLLLEYPELYEYQQVRNASVTQLVKSLREIAAAYRVEFDYILSSLGSPINLAYYEGVSISQLKALVNNFVILAYGEQPASIIHSNQIVSALAPEIPVHIVFSLSDKRISSENGLQERVRIALGQGINNINYYNFGLLNDYRISWIKNANNLIDHVRF